MKNSKKILSCSILFGSMLVLAAGCQSPSTSSTTTNTATTTATTTTVKEKKATDLIGEAMPNVTIITADSKEKTSADFKGKKTVYVAWASWCPDCQQELPILNELRKEYQDTIEFVPVNLLVKGETPEKGQSYLKDNQLEFNYYSDKEKNFQKALEIHSIPTMIFVDQEGKIKNVIDDVKDKATIEEALKGLQKRKKDDGQCPSSFCYLKILIYHFENDYLSSFLPFGATNPRPAKIDNTAGVNTTNSAEPVFGNSCFALSGAFGASATVGASAAVSFVAV